MTDHETLVLNAAARWSELRREELEIKAKMRACRCEEATVAGRIGEPFQPACRFDYQEPEGELLPLEEWCDPCRERDRLWRRLRAVTAKRAGATRTLHTVCQRWAAKVAQ